MHYIYVLTKGTGVYVSLQIFIIILHVAVNLRISHRVERCALCKSQSF